MKLEFSALDIFGNNYLSWILDAKIHLEAMNLGETIKEGNKTSLQRATTMIFIRHHLHEGLKSEYLIIKDPLIMWQNIKERYDHQKFTILPQARDCGVFCPSNQFSIGRTLHKSCSPVCKDDLGFFNHLISLQEARDIHV